MQDLERILAAVSAMPDQSLMSPERLKEQSKNLKGFEAVQLGKSAKGQPIEALHWPGSGESVVAWGFPHPDEPTGALALMMLAEALSAGRLPEFALKLDWWLVLCADPDQAAINKWIDQPSLDTYLEGNWRPLYSSLEVDYHFPIMDPPFIQTRHQAPTGIALPLPESCLLADLLDRTSPKLLGLMHANHVSGAYDYFLQRPSSDLIQAIDSVCRRLGIARHLGERPDPGRRWRTARPDLLREVELKERLRRAEVRFGPLAGRSLAGCVSAAQYLQSLRADAQVITPEVGLWQPKGIDCLSSSGQVRQITIRRFKSTKGWREGFYGNLVLPGGQTIEICYLTQPAQGPASDRTSSIPLSRGMAGVEAVEARRHLLTKADLIWKSATRQLKGQNSRWLNERRQVTVPASRVNDRSMLIFRCDQTYRRPATVAQVEDLQLRWGMQSCLWLGHTLQLYQHHNLQQQANDQQALLEEAKSGLLSGLPALADPAQAARSQIARLLLCASE